MYFSFWGGLGENIQTLWLDSEDCPQVAIPSIDPSTTSEGGSSDASVEPAGMHLVLFKCIGAQKEFHYQEILALVVKKIKQGETVPVTCRVQKSKQPSWLPCHCLWVQSEWKHLWCWCLGAARPNARVYLHVHSHHLGVVITLPDWKWVQFEKVINSYGIKDYNNYDYTEVKMSSNEWKIT